MPKLDEDDYVDLGNLPPINQSRVPPPQGLYGNHQANFHEQPNFNKTQAGNNAAQNANILVQNTNEDWINKKWRPMMGWTYMATCIFDFILAPILWAIVQFWETEAANDAFRQWEPLTLQGAGLYHMAMGAVLGIAAYGRTKEKVEGRQ